MSMYSQKVPPHFHPVLQAVRGLGLEWPGSEAKTSVQPRSQTIFLFHHLHKNSLKLASEHWNENIELHGFQIGATHEAVSTMKGESHVV